MSEPGVGIAVKVIVRQGETIQPGDLIFVLEAMKMEREIAASVGGKVAQANVKIADSVKSGQVV